MTAPRFIALAFLSLAACSRVRACGDARLAAATDDVKRVALPLLGVAPGQPVDDLAQLDPGVGEARIVAMGEATHGGRELFQLKHRFVEWLVTKKGFRAVAFEAGRAEARRVNDYVLGGAGTAAEALAGLRYWTWNTEEIVALVEWMRAYDARVAPDARVEFLGFDMDYTARAAQNVYSYLEYVDREAARATQDELTFFTRESVVEDWTALPAAARAAKQDSVAAMLRMLDERREQWVRSPAGALRWRAAREDARALAQWTEAHAADKRAGDFDFNVRDRAMAENVEDMLEGGARAKIALWAHNAHVGTELAGPLVPMGALLRKKYADAYFALGLVFAEGSFRARGGATAPKGSDLQTFALAPDDADATAPLARAELSFAAIDFRRLRAGAAKDWFAAPHPVRDVGVTFSDPVSASSEQVLSRRYDAIAFVRKTTPSVPTKTLPH